MIHRYPKVKVAAAHVAPVFLDTERTVDKACALIAEAAQAGAQLIVFPEAFVTFTGRRFKLGSPTLRRLPTQKYICGRVNIC